MGKNDPTVLTDDKSLPRSVSLYPDQWALIDEVNEQFDFRNVSLALRHIINDYRRLKNFEAIIRSTNGAQ